jgi:hypothetical protein
MGRLGRHMLALQLARVEADAADIAALDQQIADRLAPHAAQMAELTTIPGIDWVFAATIIAEIGWPAPAPAILPSRPPCATPPLPPRASAAASFRPSTTSSRAAAAAGTPPWRLRIS